MTSLEKFNQILKAILMICALLVAIGTVITFGISELLNNNKNRGVEVKKSDDRRNNKREDDHIVTISSPYFYTKTDSRFLVAEIEIRNSSEGYGALLSSNSSSSGSALYLNSKFDFMVGCSTCWFRNLIYFENAAAEGRKVFSSEVAITRFYIPDPESNSLSSDSSYSENKRKNLANFALFSVIEKDTNHDGVLNQGDEEITYISELDFSKKTRITPPATLLLEWKFDLQGSNLYLYVKQDSNGNKEYDELDKRSILITDIENPSIARAIVGPMKDATH